MVNPAKEIIKLRVIPSIYWHRSKNPAPRNKALPPNRLIEISKNYPSNTADRSDLHHFIEVPKIHEKPLPIKDCNRTKNSPYMVSECFREPLVDVIPVNHVPPIIDVRSPVILVLKIVGVLPNVYSQ